MSYIELINAAWELREQGIITLHEHDLYTYLLHKCNKLNWKNPFHQSTEVLCAILGINRNALVSRRNKLHQIGLISFREGVAKSRPAEYTLCGLRSADSCLQMSRFADVLAIPMNGERIGEEFVRMKNPIKKEIFRKPSTKEVEDYCRQRKNDIDAHTFIDFYEAKNWMIGKNKMKDWRACVRTWESKAQDARHNAAKLDSEKNYEIF